MNIGELLLESTMITGIVLVIMVIIEYINVQSKGNWANPLQKSDSLQILVAAFLGAIPGCIGTFALVSLYTHNLIRFGALVTAMIVTFGDEAFVLFAMIPKTAIKLTGILLAIGICAGFVINFLTRKRKIFPQPDFHFEIHHHTTETIINPNEILQQIRKMTWLRGLLLTALVGFFIALFSGVFEDTREWNWVKITFLVLTFFGIFVLLTVPDHFVEEHLYKHVIRKHLLKVFLWTFGALILVELFLANSGWEAWIQKNQLVILLIAVFIGIIPESGPHLVFITLFANNAVPFSILLANSIVQDGHGALPLLAEAKRSFFIAKIVNLIIGFSVGLIGFLFGW